jgi:alanine racemase
MHQQSSSSSRPNWLEYDVSTIVNNLGAVRRGTRPGTKIFAAIKGDAYGFGSVPIARALAEAGVDGFTVTDQAEAIELRRNGIGTAILLYAGHLANKETVQATVEHGLIPTLCDLGEAAEYSRLANRSLDVFVKVDVGLERVGVPAEQAADFIAQVRRMPRLTVAAIYTHLHVPANVTEDFMRWQLARFDSMVDALARSAETVPMRMVASSGALTQTHNVEYDAIDPGSLLFGSDTWVSSRISFGVQPALRAVKSRIIQVKAVVASDYPEQAPFPPRPGMRIAILPLGIRDGLPRFHAGYVLVRGRPAPIVGAPSLEHTRIDVTNIADAATGDEAVIIGRQGDAEIVLSEVIKHCGHRRLVDLMMAISPTVARVPVG